MENNNEQYKNQEDVINEENQEEVSQNSNEHKNFFAKSLQAYKKFLSNQITKKNEKKDRRRNYMENNKEKVKCLNILQIYNYLRFLYMIIVPFYLNYVYEPSLLFYDDSIVRGAERIVYDISNIYSVLFMW